jgi:hypothetical protein
MPSTPKAATGQPEFPATHVDDVLDEALKLTFPASDPIAVALEPAATVDETPENKPTGGGKEGKQQKPT